MNNILKNKIVIFAIILVIIIIAIFSFLKSGDDDLNESKSEELGAYTIVDEMTNYVLFNIDDKEFVVELYISEAPITVTNFKSLVKESFYDGVSVYTISKNELMQMGDFNSEANNYPITGEFSENGIENNLSHEQGVLSMSTAGSYDSATNHFFICLGEDNNTWRDGSSAAFGKVIIGLEELLKFNEYETNYATPIDDVVINSIQFVQLNN